MVEKYGDIQMLYYGHHMGGDQHKRDTYDGHLYFDDCATFCEPWDQASFDPDYASLDMAFFAPMVREVFARAPYDPSVLRKGERPPLFEQNNSQIRSY